MSSRSLISARVQIAAFALFVVLMVAASLSIDLSKFQQRGADRGEAALRGIGSPGELEKAVRQHPSNNTLQLMAKATTAVEKTKGAIAQLSAQIEPAALSKELNFGSVSRDELESFRRDLKTAETNALTFPPRYAAILKAEHDQIESAVASSHVSTEIADQLRRGMAQRQAKMLNTISQILLARVDYYRAYDNYIAFLSSELGSFKIVAGQFIFPLQRSVERYNAVAQAMTSAGRRVNDLETGMKKQQQSLPEEWMPMVGAK